MMKITVIAIALIVTFVGIGAYFFLNNLSLEREILIAKQACENKATELEQQFNIEINELYARLPEQHDAPGPASTTPHMMNLNAMTSYGHQVRAVTQKYEFLLKSAQIDAERKKHLRRLLVKREQLDRTIDQSSVNPATNDLSELTSELAKTEESIKDLLRDPIDYIRYKDLR